MDLGDAYCLELRRTAIGPFRVEDAAPPPERGVDPGGWTPRVVGLADALRGVLPDVALDADRADRAGHGQTLPAPHGAPDGDVLLLDPAGDPVCVAHVADGRVKPRVGFRT
jgi:tRNA pseudouridine55 synthase